MNEVKVSTHEMTNGGVIEKFKLEGLFYVKSAVAGVVKFSEAVSECKADYFVFDAINYGGLDF